MKYISTGQKSQPLDLPQAMISSIADDGGLFMPEHLPAIPRAFFNNFGAMSFPEIAYVPASLLFSDDVQPGTLKRIAESSFDFPLPIRQLDHNLFVAELFHGPTLAVKDFSVRFMARMMGAMSAENPAAFGAAGKLHVLVATTGNTGSAIANGFARTPGVEVYILFPRGTAGRQLEAQFTTIGHNIHALEVHGTIDDCQAMVSQAFADTNLRSQVSLTSANSVNVVRVLAQSFMYFYIMSRVREMLAPGTPVSVAIPSGNLGNLTGALIAQKMGLDFDRIIAAENANCYLSRFMRSGTSTIPSRAIPTLAYAADKGSPTNLARVLHLTGNSVDGLRRAIDAVSVDDAAIIDAVNHSMANYGYIIDPHTALAYQAMRRSLQPGHAGVVLATAHPAKSLTAMTAITGKPMELPLQLTRFMDGTDMRQRIAPSYEALRRIILKNA
ncbi:MAG: threonine synthase [Muribaculaceae bacterium]|nr:threonine synthase [Muribaculaceae bacterium]